MLQRVMSRFFVKNFLSRSTETFRRETLLCLRKFLVSKNVKDKRGGRYHDFPSKLFCLTAPKHFVEETFCGVFQKIFCFSIETFRRRALPGSRENRESFMLIRPPPPPPPLSFNSPCPHTIIHLRNNWRRNVSTHEQVNLSQSETSSLLRGGGG